MQNHRPPPGPTPDYTVGYRKGPPANPKGSLVQGQSVKVKDGMIFDVTPTDWKMTFDGDTVSLSPSVGNWELPCRSHYVIKRDVVHWAGDMTREEIEGGRAADRQRKAVYYGERPLDGAAAALPKTSTHMLSQTQKRA